LDNRELALSEDEGRLFPHELGQVV